MKIQNAKQLQQLLKLCAASGVTSMKIDGIEFVLGPKPHKAPKYVDNTSDIFPEANIPIPVYTGGSSEPDVIKTEEFTDEQKMFYSVRDTSESVN